MDNIYIKMADDGSLTADSTDSGYIEEYRAKQIVINLNSLFKSDLISYYTVSFEPYGLGKKIVTDNIYKDISDDDIFYSAGSIYCPLYDYITVAPTVTVQVDGYETDFNGDITGIYKSGLIDLRFSPSLTGKGIVPDFTNGELKLYERIEGVVEEQLGQLIIDNEKLADGCVSEEKLASNCITSEKIKPASITASKIASASITSDKIAAGNVTGDKIPSLAISESHLKNNSVTNTKLASASVTSAKIASYSVTSAKIATGAVTKDKIASSSIDNSRLCENAVTSSKISGGAVTADKISSFSVDSTKLANNSVSTEKIIDGAVKTSKISDGSVTPEKLSEKYLTQTDLDSALENVGGSVGSEEEIDNIISLSVTEIPNEKYKFGYYISASTSNNYTNYMKQLATTSQSAVCCLHLPVRFNKTYFVDIDFTPIAEKLKNTGGTVYPFGHSAHMASKIVTLSRKTEDGFELVGGKAVNHHLISNGGEFVINNSSSCGKVTAEIKIDDNFFKTYHANADFSGNTGKFVDNELLYLSFNLFYITSPSDKLTNTQWEEALDLISENKIYISEKDVSSEIAEINENLNSILSLVVGGDA